MLFQLAVVDGVVSSVPAATLVILLPAAWMPDLITLGPPVMVRPVCIQFAVACGDAVNSDVFGQFQLCATGYGFADDVAVAFDIDGVAQCVVVAAAYAE